MADFVKQCHKNRIAFSWQYWYIVKRRVTRGPVSVDKVITCHPHAVVINLQFAFRQGNLLSSPRIGYSSSGGRLVKDLYCETSVRTEPMLKVETFAILNITTESRYGPHTEYKLIYFPASALY